MSDYFVKNTVAFRATVMIVSKDTNLKGLSFPKKETVMHHKTYPFSKYYSIRMYLGISI